MIRHIHHPSCPAGHTAGAGCLCPTPAARRRTQLAELVSLAAMLGLMAGIPIYLLWRYVA
jgi:hypothetical protein